MQDSIIEALSEASKARNSYTETFDGLMESASALMPARHVFDDNEIAFSTIARYSGPPWLYTIFICLNKTRTQLNIKSNQSKSY